eukprot:14421782-Alexandrium_andersonii.AAC.1
MRPLPRPVSLLRSSGAAAVAVGCRPTRASSRRGGRRCAGQLRSRCRPGCVAGWRVLVCLSA